MKVGMVILNTTSLVHDSRVRKEANALVRAGHHVRLVGLRQAGEAAIEHLDEVELVLFELKSRLLLKTSLLLPIKYAEFILRSLWKLIHFKAHVYHAHDLEALLPAWLAAKLTRARVIYDAHELFTERPIEMRAVWRVMERFLLNRVDAVIAASVERAEIMYQEYGAKELPTVLLNTPYRNGKPSSSTVRDYLPPEYKGKRILLYQGGLSPNRCLESLILAERFLNKSVILVFLGNLTPFSESVLKSLVKQHRLEERVFFIRAVDPSELTSFITSADIGVVIYKNTSRNNYYCAPNKLFDYCMAGLPIVGCDFPPVRSIVQKYGVGRLFKPENPKSIADAVNGYLTDPMSYEEAKLKTNALAADFNWERESQKLIHLYGKFDSR